jgi:1-acyl-sn-glycerol-3-phosphate acyltransferase
MPGCFVYFLLKGVTMLKKTKNRVKWFVYTSAFLFILFLLSQAFAKPRVNGSLVAPPSNSSSK